jgi:hypothetical protein
MSRPDPRTRVDVPATTAPSAWRALLVTAVRQRPAKMPPGDPQAADHQRPTSPHFANSCSNLP